MLLKKIFHVFLSNKDKINEKNYNFDESLFLSYLIPFFFTHSISLIAMGSFYSLKYSVLYEGIHVRLFGVVFLIFSLNIFYNFYVKIPKMIGGKEKAKKVMEIIISSKFFYIFLITLIFVFLIAFFKIRYGNIILYVLILLNYFLQISLNKSVKKLLNYD